MALKKRIVVLTGAGMSAESGIQTFRDADGLWEGHDVMEVATPGGWEKNKSLVLDFYNQRRKQLFEVKPNEGHEILSDLEKYFDLDIITQNVDDLHERAGSSSVLHLHGELRKVRSTKDKSLIYDWDAEVKLGDVCEKGHQLRPHIVWFGEDVPNLELAIKITQTADILVIIGTSMQVYPAANLIYEVGVNTPIYFIDPKPNVDQNNFKNIYIIPKGASEGMKKLSKFLLENLLQHN